MGLGCACPVNTVLRKVAAVAHAEKWIACARRSSCFTCSPLHAVLFCRGAAVDRAAVFLRLWVRGVVCGVCVCSCMSRHHFVVVMSLLLFWG
jgi:hypothetical protein